MVFISPLFSRPWRSQGLLYKHLCDSSISLRRRHALLVADGALSHKIHYVTIFKEMLNPKGHPNRSAGSKVTAILLNGGFFPLVELHWEGSAPRACAAGLFWYIDNTQTYRLSNIYKKKKVNYFSFHVRV